MRNLLQHLRLRRPSWRGALRLAAVVCCMAVAGSVDADMVRLHASADVAGPNVQLKDVATLQGDRAAALGKLIVGKFDGKSDHLTLRLSEVDAKLRKHDVNFAMVSLGGFASCVVRQTKPQPSSAALSDAATLVGKHAPTGGAEHTPAGDGKQAAVPGDPSTLRQRVAAVIGHMTGASSDQLQINFASGDQKVLAQAVGMDRIEVQPQTTIVPGRVPLTIRRYHGESLIETSHVNANVALRYKALVVKQALSRGDVITADDLILRQVNLTVPGQPVTDVDQAIGQVAKTSLRPGMILMADELTPPLMVKRGDLLTARCICGGLVVTTAARAMEPGVKGQLITVRNEKTRQTYMLRITGDHQGVMTVPGGGSDKPDKSSRAAVTHSQAVNHSQTKATP